MYKITMEVTASYDNLDAESDVASRPESPALAAAVRESLSDTQDSTSISLHDIVANAVEATMTTMTTMTTVHKDAVIADHRDDLTCTVCREIMYKPVTLICQHSFCRVCIERMQQKSCPLCRVNFVMPVEYNRPLGSIAGKCFPTEYEKSCLEEEMYEYAKTAQQRIETELYRQIFNQATANSAQIRAEERRPIQVSQRASYWERVQRRLPESTHFIFNPQHVLTTFYTLSRRNLTWRLVDFGLWIAIMLSIPLFNKHVTTVMTVAFAFNVIMLAIRGFSLFSMFVVGKMMNNAVYEESTNNVVQVVGIPNEIRQILMTMQHLTNTR